MRVCVLGNNSSINPGLSHLFQVQTVQHVYPTQVQYVEGGEAVYTNGTM